MMKLMISVESIFWLQKKEDLLKNFTVLQMQT